MFTCLPGLGDHGEDKVRRLERRWDPPSVKLVFHVTARLPAASQVLDHLQLLVRHLKVDFFKLPKITPTCLHKYSGSPVLINFSADISPLVTPHIPARSTTKLSGKAVLDTNRELVPLVLLAGVLGDIQLNMLRC